MRRDSRREEGGVGVRRACRGRMKGGEGGEKVFSFILKFFQVGRKLGALYIYGDMAVVRRRSGNNAVFFHSPKIIQITKFLSIWPIIAPISALPSRPAISIFPSAGEVGGGGVEGFDVDRITRSPGKGYCGTEEPFRPLPHH